MTRLCFRCRTPRPESELLRVTTVGAAKPPFYICRPSVSEKLCFKWVGSASVHRIEPADRGECGNCGGALAECGGTECGGLVA